MIDPSKYIVLNRSNYRQYAAPAGASQSVQLNPILRGSTGYQGWQKPGQPHAFCGPRPVASIIPRSEWPDRIRAGQGLKAFNAIQTVPIKSKDQNGLNYCWGYGSTRAVELRRVILGLRHVELSPESVCGPATGWRNVGGYASEAFDQIQKAGICEESFLDKPCSLHPSRWKAGWQDNAKLHEAVDWYNLDSSDGKIFDEVITCLLNDSPVAAGLGWWGHLVCFVAPVSFADGTFGVLFQNSWLQGDWPRPGDNGLAILVESLATPDGAAAPIITIDAPAVDPTVPNDPPPELDPTL